MYYALYSLRYLTNLKCMYVRMYIYIYIYIYALYVEF